MKAITIALTIPLVLGCGGGTVSAAPNPRVSIETGVLEGRGEDGAHVYRGIPYAAPPVGDLRWRAPQPAASWDGVKDAGAYGPICPQARNVQQPESEDCLTVNVWTQAGPHTKPLPVMVWIHGGSNRNGSGDLRDQSEGGRFRPTAFAKSGVVLVSLNYRLGLLGTFAHPAIRDTRPEGEPGMNYFILDQIAALKWVRRNAEAFGGDPNRVTIFGVSAGASNINYLMTSPLAAGLFHRAIAQSAANGFVISPGIESMIASSMKRGIALGEEMGVAEADDVAVALRSLPWRNVVWNSESGDFRRTRGGVADGVILLDAPGEIFRKGRQHNVPYVAGANGFEGAHRGCSAATRRSRGFEAKKEAVAAVYGMAPDDRLLYPRVCGDMTWVAPTRYLAKQMKSVSAPAWRYHFNYVLEALAPIWPGTFHGDEVRFVFNRPGPVIISEEQSKSYLKNLGIKVKAGRYQASERDMEVANTVHNLWVQLAKTGDPNGPGLPEWPKYTEETDMTLLISNEQIGSVQGLHREQLDFLEADYIARRDK